ncbi:MAG: glycine cleavage system protein GcvH [Gammaproteobacteria bacterium]|nr:glycine cleavage system protein GcvH [Gammaproteobacteria bacterium]MCG3146326.1 Glycine cleavage system H protein [Gammaproteobacteria bacterium]
MSELKYSRDHEWLRVEADGTVTIGITDYAQKELGDVVYVELPEIGREVRQDEEAAVVESVKAASEVRMPVAGSVVAVNGTLADNPEQVNVDPAGDGWFLRLKPSSPDQIAGLMNEADYRAYVDSIRK